MAACTNCGFQSPSAFKFCGQCGSPLPEASSAASPPEAERRQLTVLFCDLVGSTALSERLDPEDLRDLLAAYHRTCGTIIQRLGGHLAQLLGDGLLVYFGFPTAHADDARRAVQASLEILETLERTPVRIGIHTGMVVVGDLGHEGHREQLALGQTPNIAARLQGLAGPDTVVLSEDTRRLCEHDFHFEDLGEHDLKGISQPIRVFRAVGPAARQWPPARDPLPLIGREAELETLGWWWNQARSGSGRVGILRGRPGTGRSRLARELRARALAEGARTLVACCSELHRGTPLYPVTDLFERLLGLERGSSPESRIERLQSTLQGPPESLPYLATLLGLPSPDPVPAGITPQALRQRILGALRAELEAMSESSPVLLVLEELDLADPTTLELVAHLAERVARKPILILALLDTLALPLPDGVPVAEVELGPLSWAQTRQLVRTLAPELDEDSLEILAARSDGVPVHVRELVRLAQESGDTQGIPSSLQGSLMARLDQQADSKQVAQLGATIGRRFRRDLLAELSEGPIAPHLDRLVRNDLLDHREDRYAFQSALLHDAAYQSLLKSVRQRYHERIAATLERSFPEVLAGQPEVLAHHLTEARDYPRALHYWIRAGDLAMTLSANEAALRSYERALGLLVHLAEPSRSESELRLRTSMAPALIALRGYASSEVEETYERARELCRLLGESSSQFPVLAGLWVFHLVRGHLAASEDLAKRLLDLAEEDPTRLLVAHTALGQTAFWSGRLREAIRQLQEGLDRHDPGRDRRLAQTYFGTDPAVGALSYLSWARWLEGSPEESLEASDRSLALAERLEHAHSVAHARIFACWLHLNLGRLETARVLSAETLVLSAEQGFPLWLGVARVLGGWASGAEGAGEVQEGLQILEATQTRLGVSYFAGLLATLHAATGNSGRALEVLDQTGVLEERWWAPELQRIRAGILKSRGHLEAARRLLEEAHAQASRNGALALTERIRAELES